MGRLVCLVLLVAAAYLVWNRVELSGAGTRVEGSRVIVDADELEASFSRFDPFSESYMIFGGLNDRPRNSFSHVTLAALPMSDARRIHRSHPDFHMCSSPGAEQAKQLVQTRNFVAASGAVRKTLVEALDVFEERLHGGGERTCVRVSGAELALDTVHLKQNGMDITQDVKPAMQLTFQLAEEAEIVDCKEQLAGAG